jgi:hypothetical protein
MRWAQGLLLAAIALLVTAPPSLGESNTARAESYIRKACESVWGEASEYQVERCTDRAMASLDDTNRLRDNELKRLLMDSERELDRCRQELDQAKDHTPARHGETTARHKPQSSNES